jgi:hypothetical protein
LRFRTLFVKMRYFILGTTPIYPCLLDLCQCLKLLKIPPPSPRLITITYIHCHDFFKVYIRNTRDGTKVFARRWHPGVSRVLTVSLHTHPLLWSVTTFLNLRFLLTRTMRGPPSSISYFRNRQIWHSSCEAGIWGLD